MTQQSQFCQNCKMAKHNIESADAIFDKGEICNNAAIQQEE